MAASDDGTISCWDVSTFALLRVFGQAGSAPVVCLATVLLPTEAFSSASMAQKAKVINQFQRQLPDSPQVILSAIKKQESQAVASLTDLDDRLEAEHEKLQNEHEKLLIMYDELYKITVKNI